MAAELCGAKLLAPIFGGSLSVWAAVMGITLAALASGYFFGGLVSERSEKHSLNLYRVLNSAALFIIVMPVISHYAIPWISYLPFLPGVVISTFALLFLPVFFLGASSPLFILVQTTQNHMAGKVSGMVYAISTVGGIFATFLCGFYFIPEIGLKACLVFFGGMLFATNFSVFKIFKPHHFFLFAAFIYLNLQFMTKSSASLMSSDSMLGRVEVKDLIGEKNNPYRILTVNDIVQTEMSLKSKKSLSAYVKLIDTLVPLKTGDHSALILGLGGGLTANLFKEKNYTTHGVELDKRIIDAAKKYFYLDEDISVFYQDARYFLNTCTMVYDVILVDIFKGEEQPSHILTKESLEKLKNNLTPSSLLLVNWHGYLHGTKGKGSAILYNTLTHAGFKVKLCGTSADENYRNVLFVASLSDLRDLPYELHEPVEGTDLINTDNLPLLEKYNAEANKAWRLNYLRYYQNRN